MKRVGMTWQARPECWEQYRDIHLNAWPELLETFAAHGVHNFNCFAFGTRIFAYMEIEGDDVYKVLNEVAETEVKKRWDAQVMPWLYPEAAEGAGVTFLDLEHIFYSP